jgi:prolipoprotein diacylglyceryltransferase
MYFLGRFTVEFFKEYHVLKAGLTMGQYLSIVPFCMGIGLLIWTAFKVRKN